jgi:hypothetical protein
MDSLTRYRNLIKQLFQERAELMNRHPVSGLETLCVLDEAHDQYLVYTIGWSQGKRVQYVTLLARIRDGKIWIEEDGTEEGLANLLVGAGVPKEEIVLAFTPPELRAMTDYALA